ncbi:MAG TPA: nuclear transport factor 2 family protein [Terriglobales bacterium]|jgi:hypothetical protein
MQQVLFVLTFLAMGLVATSNVAAQTLESGSKTEQEIRKLNTEETDAFIHKDPSVMERLWSDDFVVTNPLNKFVNKQQVLGLMRSGFLIITAYARQIEYLRQYGDMVIVAGPETVTWGGKMPKAGQTEHLRFTAVWMKQNGRWQEIARHANIVPEGTPQP